MSLLWAVPPVAVAAAVVIVLVQLRHIGAATSDLRLELQRVGEVRAAVLELRTSTAEARTSIHGLRRS
ncbi:MAG: hypothetical protein ACSLFP_06305 [Acidimicrobiales bacterium]